jgi:RNA-directed DNA polymerase
MQGETRWSVPLVSAMSRSILLRALAAAMVAGEQSVDSIAARLARTLGKRWRWLRPLAKRYVRTFEGGVRPRQRDVVQFLSRDKGFRRSRSKYFGELWVAEWLNEPQSMQPVGTAAGWDVPAIESVGVLAEWLGLQVSDLLWLADLKGLTYRLKPPQLRHYHYRVLAKPSGNIRLIEAPKNRLKAVQRQILSRILERIPPHPAAQGFLKGRSIKTFVAPHVGQRVVLRMDLQDFFPTFAAARIQTFFRVMGYPEAVADLLGGLCTTATPREVWKEVAGKVDPNVVWEARSLYARPHLPQGAPTSPALANLCAYRLDCRLGGLARTVGAEYTRYADDLAFSGGEVFEKSVERFSIHVAAILMEEGFRVHHRKTRVMRQGVRQHLAGLVANQRLNIMRPDFDRLKATLANCVRMGPGSQNREAHPQFRAHLEGRVTFVEMVNPGRGKRLRDLYERIAWS